MKTRKRMQRFLSVLVTLTMILGMFPATALAVEEKPSDLPTATVTKIKNNDLTFALNFKANPATDDQLAKYGSWYADFVLTVNKDVTFNANGEADGYLSGQYDAWSDNWVNVPFEDVTLKAGESLKIMAYAAEMLGEPGLKYTYGEVYEFVKDFDCGVYFEDEFLQANPDLEVTLALRMYNNEDESESYVIGTTYTYTAKMVTPDLPTATVTELDNDELTFALNFLADEATDEQLAYYGDWYADFELKLNKTFTANADGDADGYLAGQYENWSEEWLKVPYGIDGGVTVEANTPVKVMESAAALMGQEGLKLTYNDVYTFVKEFNCGLFIEDAYLAANPDLVATLELRMYNPADESESYVIGRTYTFEVPTGEPDKDPVVELPADIVDSVVAGSDAASETEKQALKDAVESIVDEIVENTAVNGYEVQLPNEVETITITLSDMDVKTGTGEVVPTKITYTVEPKNVGGDKVSKPTEPITFRLPVPANVTAKSAKVYHDGVEMENLFTIQGSGNAKYVEVSSAEFSDFAVEPINEPTAPAGVAKVDTLDELQAALAADNDLPIVVTATIKIPVGETVVLDLNGKTVTSVYQTDSTTKHIYPLDVYGDLTIEDTKDNGSISGRGILVQAGSKLTVDGGSIYAIDSNGGSALFMYGGDVVINGGHIEQKAEGTYNFAIQAPAGTVTVNGGWVGGNHGAIAAGGAAVVLNGGEFVCTGTAGMTDNVLYTYDTGSITINGGTFVADNDGPAGGCCVYDANGRATINGGTFGNSSGGDVWGTTGTTIKGGTFENLIEKQHIASGYELSEDGKVIASAPAVAKIGEQGYTSLQAAIEAVQDGEIIVLQDDLTVTTKAYGDNALNHARAVSFTLDLNGKTLSANTGNSVFRFNIANSGATSDVTVTIKNGKVEAGSSTWCALMASGISADVKAVLKLEDLTVESSKPGDLAIKAWANSLIEAKNVTVNATNGAGGFYALGGEMVLDNCTVNQKGLHTAPYLSMAVAVSTGGKATINSGTYSAEPTAAAEGDNQGTSHGSWTAGVMNSGGTLIINGGTFSNGNFGDDSLATAARGLIFADTNGKVEVNGGTFNALKSVFDFQNNLAGTSPVFTIKGGTYSANPEVVTSYGSVAIADGYCVTVTNGVYTVAKAVAKIGETPYATIAAAIAAAQDGDTVVILPGEYGAINISNKNITIKGTVGENGELLTTIKGGNPAITGHGFNGTIRDLKIVDAFKVMYAEPAGNVTVDNVYVTGATYGFHLVAYSTGLTWTIQNSYMDLSWANSFGVYGNGDAEIIIKENTLVSTEPYYPEYGALLVNSFLPDVTVEENVFGENAKIMIRPDVTDTSKVNISKNYHADGVENAFVDDGVKVDITKYYAELNDNGTINKDSLVEVSANVAEVNGVKYATLAEAVEAAQTGETIKLIDNVVLSEVVVIPVGKTMTLDLNGKTVSMEESILTTAYAINNLGNLTLMDSVGGGSINARGIYNGYVDGGENVATAKLTVESGTYNAMGTNGGATIFNYGIVDINGGKFTSAGGYGLNNQAGASMAISNAEVNGGIYNMGSLTVENTKVYQHLSGKHAIYNWSATLVIESGEFDSVSGNELILADGQNSSVVINGGTFNKTAKSWLFGAATGKNISFTINDGIFNGYVNLPEGSVDTIRPYNDPIVVKGGMFNFDPTKWVAEGYEVKYADGTWTVQEKEETILVDLSPVKGQAAVYKDVVKLLYRLKEIKGYTEADILNRAQVLVWTGEDVNDEATYEKGTETEALTYEKNEGIYEALGSGIPAKNMGDIQKFRIYLVDEAGVVHYSPVYEYSLKQYAINMYGKASTPQKERDLLVALMNYGAAAQKLFNHRTDDLMNAWLPEDLQNVYTGYTAAALKADDAGKFNFESDSVWNRIGREAVYIGAIELQIKLDQLDAYKGAKYTLLYWNEETYNAATALTMDNATAVEMTEDSDGYMVGRVTKIPARSLGDTTYFCVMVEKDGETFYSALQTYSLHYYAERRIANANAQETEKNLCKSMLLYSNAAEKLFG